MGRIRRIEVRHFSRLSVINGEPSIEHRQEKNTENSKAPVKEKRDTIKNIDASFLKK